MISEENFRKTEGRLYRYYLQKNQIKKLKHKTLVLYEHKKAIEKDLRETNIHIEPESKSIDYSEKVQNSSSGISYAEGAAIKEIEKLQREFTATTKHILKTHAKVRELERDIVDTEYIIGLLNEECKQFSELKYGEKKSIYEIADRLNMGKSTAARRREEIVTDVSNMFFNKYDYY